MKVFLQTSHFPQNINKVEVYKRIIKSEWTERFAQVELRIGNNDESNKGLSQFSSNTWVGYYGSGNHDPVATFQFEPRSGRFMTLQILAQNHLEINELFVYST